MTHTNLCFSFSQVKALTYPVKYLLGDEHMLADIYGSWMVDDNEWIPCLSSSTIMQLTFRDEERRFDIHFILIIKCTSPYLVILVSMLASALSSHLRK